VSMKLEKRYSTEPLLELRTDFGSADGRTVQGRCYVWFSAMEDGRLQKRMKAMPHLSVEEAMWFIEDNLEYLLAFSGQGDAVDQFHELFKGSGFDVRHNKGRAWHPVEVSTAPTPELLPRTPEPEVIPAEGGAV
jgi:hypothetical protein